MGKTVKRELQNMKRYVKSLISNEILVWLKRAQATPEFQLYRHFL